MQGTYRNDIDGLRGVAVLCVVLFHLKLAGFSGGFVGVDVFFVISGFLIAGLIARDLNHGVFSSLDFYRRRIRRILPALVLVTVATAVVAASLFPPLTFKAFAQSVLAMATLRSNSFFAHNSKWGGYFANDQDAPPLLHTWSLSVEEQFYLLFPIGLVLLFRFFPGSRTRLIAATMLLSFAYSVWLTRHEPVLAFYLLLSRGWELLLGAFFAIVSVPAIPRIARELAALTGISAILFAVVHYTGETSFPGIGAILPCLGSALILFVGKAGGSVTNQVLRFKPLVLVGLISYSLYLWHWPIIAFHRYIFDMSFYYSPSNRAIFFILLASVTLASLSYRFIERPFRGSSSRFTDRQVVGLAAASFVTLVGFGASVSALQGLPGRFDPTTRHRMVENSLRPSDWNGLGECTNFRTNPQQLSDLKFCEVHHAPRNIFFWGDSHVQQLYPLVDQLALDQKLNGRGAVFAIAPGCPPMDRTNRTDGYHCDKFTRFAEQRALQADIDTVFLESSTWWTNPNSLCAAKQDGCGPVLSQHEAVQTMLADLTLRIRKLHSAGKRVIVGLPFPTYRENPPNYEIVHARLGRMMNIPAPLLRLPELRPELQAIASQEAADIYDPLISLCHNSTCIYSIGDVSIYKDYTHIAASQIGILKDHFLDVLDREPASPPPGVPARKLTP